MKKPTVRITLQRWYLNRDENWEDELWTEDHTQEGYEKRAEHVSKSTLGRLSIIKIEPIDPSEQPEQ